MAATKLLGHEDYLREKLYEWRFETLAQRVRHIEEDLGIEMTPQALGVHYRRLGFRYRRPNYHISNTYTDA